MFRYCNKMLHWGPLNHVKRALLLLCLLHPLQGVTTTPQLQDLPPTTTATLEQEARQRQLAVLAQQLATTLAHAQPKTLLQQKAYDHLNRRLAEETETWLNQFGQARVTLSGDWFKQKLHGGLSFLLPIDGGDPDYLTFSEWHLRHKNKETTANFGIGYRHRVQEWLLGYNLFFDYHANRSHSRIGLGAEAWRDYLMLSGNGYLALSKWKKSTDMPGYEERAANGFDIRLQGYLPTYPQLGAKLNYAHYFGEKVDLFQDGKREKNPSAVTVGLQYTPVPLFTVGMDYSINPYQQNQHQLQANLLLQYRLNTPLEHQLQGDKVAEWRRLPVNRYAFVERNHDIVLQYQKPEKSAQSTQAVQQLELTITPEKIELTENKPCNVTVTANNGISFGTVEWKGIDNSDSTFIITEIKDSSSSSKKEYTITSSKIGTRTLTLHASDMSGNSFTPKKVKIDCYATILSFTPSTISGEKEQEITRDKLTYTMDPNITGITIDNIKITADAPFETHSGKIEPTKIKLPNKIGSYTLTAHIEKDHQTISNEVKLTLTVTETLEITADTLASNLLKDKTSLLLVNGTFTLTATGGNSTQPYTWKNLNTGGKLSSTTGKKITVTVDNNKNPIEIELTNAAKKKIFTLKRDKMVIDLAELKTSYNTVSSFISSKGTLPTKEQFTKLSTYWKDAMVKLDLFKPITTDTGGNKYSKAVFFAATTPAELSKGAENYNIMLQRPLDTLLNSNTADAYPAYIITVEGK